MSGAQIASLLQSGRPCLEAVTQQALPVGNEILFVLEQVGREPKQILLENVMQTVGLCPGGSSHRSCQA